MSGVEGEEILQEREKKLQGHLLCCGLAQAEIRHRIMVGHPRKEGSMATGRLGLTVAPLLSQYSFPNHLPNSSDVSQG